MEGFDSVVGVSIGQLPDQPLAQLIGEEEVVLLEVGGKKLLLQGSHVLLGRTDEIHSLEMH